MQEVYEILHALPWFAWVAIVAIICGTINSNIKRGMRHKERMAMIEKGMHPDAHRKRPGIDGPFPE